MPNAPTQNQIGALQAGNANCVTSGPFGDASHNGTPDVVTVYAAGRDPRDELMGAVLLSYALGKTTHEIADELNAASGAPHFSEAAIHNFVFGRRASIQRSKS